jgi:hypothetical protein
VLEPAAQRYEEEEHGGRVEEGHGRGVLHHDHASEDHAHAVHVGDGGGQHHQHVHVGCSVPERRARLQKKMLCSLSLKPVLRIRIRHVFGPPGSGSISQRYGSGSGSFPFLIKMLRGLK